MATFKESGITHSEEFIYIDKLIRVLESKGVTLDSTPFTYSEKMARFEGSLYRIRIAYFKNLPFIDYLKEFLSFAKRIKEHKFKNKSINLGYVSIGFCKEYYDLEIIAYVENKNS